MRKSERLGRIGVGGRVEAGDARRVAPEDRVRHPKAHSTST
jgi:hypothetical protein